MPNIFLISDTHFSHKGMCTFLREDGLTKERPFNTVEEMDEALIANWNSVVKPKDTVFHLGDVVINRSALPIISRLNGVKTLIRGNHDVFRLNEYTPYFKDIKGSHKLDDFVLTHIPVHPCSVGRWKANIHGHLHSKRVYKEKFVMVSYWADGSILEEEHYEDAIDDRYFCVSVEQINYTPIAFEEARKLIVEQQHE